MSAIKVFRALSDAVRRRSRPPAVRLAHEKRAYERELRAAGHSRAEAVTLASEKFRNHD